MDDIIHCSVSCNIWRVGFSRIHAQLFIEAGGLAGNSVDHGISICIDAPKSFLIYLAIPFRLVIGVAEGKTQYTLVRHYISFYI